MSLARSIGKSAAGFLFFVAIGATLTLFSLSVLTEYDSIKEIISKVLQQTPEASTSQFTAEEKEMIIQGLKSECQGKEYIDGASLPIEGEVRIKCSNLESIGPNDFDSLLQVSVADTLYYKSYNCSFLDCIRSGQSYMPLIITEMAHKFYNEAFIYSLIITIAIGAIFVLLIEDTKSRLKSVGWVLVTTSVPFIALNFLIDPVVALIAPEQSAQIVQSIMKTLFSPLFNIYIYLLVAGIALIAAGFLIKSKEKRSIYPM